MKLLNIVLIAFLHAPFTLHAEEAGDPKILVILPEKVDVEWYWYFYTASSEHIVQSRVEKQLLRNEFEVLDLGTLDEFPYKGSIDNLLTKERAIDVARNMGADFLVLGTASAVNASRGSAYGVNVYRSSANVTVKLLRVNDGKVLGVEDTEATEGAESQRKAARNALKAAGKDIAKAVLKMCRKHVVGDS